MMNNKLYPIGIQNFEKIRKDGYFTLIRRHWFINLSKQAVITF